jgi:mannosylglycerate hydrolase
MATKSPPRALRAVLVSHTRWERAGYLPFEGHRAGLVRLLDQLLAILELDPSFAAFTLDGQTVLLDDYLEVRPERRAEIERHVRAGRLVVGPCFVLPDELLVSGEALVRNLQRGLTTARALGASQRDGYLPDGFGHVAQLPQILQGFGLRSFVFLRGVGRELFERAGVEFAWEAPDGSRVLALYLRDGYDNAAALGQPERWGDFSGRAPDPELAAARLAEAVGELAPHARSGVIVLCSGGDHRMPEAEAPCLLEAARARLPEVELEQGTFERAVDLVLAAGSELPVQRGELLGNLHHALLSGTWSARIDRKLLNHEAQSLLEKLAEPLCAALGPRAGAFAAPLDVAWKSLLLAHPLHDVCGCSIDPVQEDGRFRLRQACDLAEALVEEALRALALASGVARRAGAEPIAVFNPHLEPWSGAVALLVQWDGPLTDAELDDLALLDPDGKPVRVHVERVASDSSGARHLRFRRGDLLSVEFEARLPGVGLGFWELVRGAGPQAFDEPLDGATIENEHLCVEARHDGTLAILHKPSGRRFEGALALESQSDLGDLYSFGPDPDTDPAWTLGRAKVKAEAWRSDGAAHLALELTWKVPWVHPREREERALRADTVVRLPDGAARLEFETLVDTLLTDHRLRVLLPLPPGTSALASDQAFALVRRERVREVTPEEAPERWQGHPGELDAPTQFSQSLVHAAGAQVGVLVAHRGLHEHEIVDAPPDWPGRGTFLALTLWRGVGALSREGGRLRRGQAGPSLPTPGAQRPPPGFAAAYAWEVVPGEAEAADVAPRAFAFAHPVHAAQVWLGAHERPPSPAAGARPLARRRALLSCDNPRLSLSALRVEQDGSVLVRLWNRGARREEARLALGADLISAGLPARAERTRLDGTPLASVPLEGAIARIEVGPAAVETVLFRFEERA